MNKEHLIAAALAQRAEWLDMDGGKRVRVRRPSEVESLALLRKADDGVPYLAAGAPEVKKHVVGWEGFSEADFAASGSSDALEFDADLWAVWIDDQRAAMQKVAQKIVDLVAAHEKAVADTEKN
jgi:hypothetical protein